MVIFINPRASGAKSLKKWARIKPVLNHQLTKAKVMILNAPGSIAHHIIREWNNGETEFVAAGGDGTVNLILQQLIEQIPTSQRTRIKLGAIGLGSSNDFHKPIKDQNRIKGVPVKIDFDSVRARDVGVLTFVDSENRRHHRYWLLNASVGITAEANRLFNSPDRLLSALKKYLTSTAILYAALHTIATYRNIDMRIRFGDQPEKQVRVTNLGLVKNPHFSGNFCYDSLYEPDSGCFYAHLCRDMNTPQILRTLWHLSHARFNELPGTHTFRLNQLHLQSDLPFAVEFDGEVIVTREASFHIKKQCIKVCRQ